MAEERKINVQRLFMECWAARIMPRHECGLDDGVTGESCIQDQSDDVFVASMNYVSLK